MAQQTHVIKAKAGSYMAQGQQKNKHVTVMKKFTNDDGSVFYVMSPTFNPAGFVQEFGKDLIFNEYPIDDERPAMKPVNHNPQYNDYQSNNKQSQAASSDW